MNSNSQADVRVFRAPSILMLMASVFALSAAIAGEPGVEVRSETVKFQDLNLDTSAGVETLYTRIHSAAKHVCSESDPIRGSAAAACARESEARAIEKVNLPALTAYYQMKTGNRTERLVAKR